jgi:hypothetical protein
MRPEGLIKHDITVYLNLVSFVFHTQIYCEVVSYTDFPLATSFEARLCHATK